MTRTFVMLALTLAARAEPAARLERAIDLPAEAQRLRDMGVPAAEVALAIRSAREHGLSAGDATDLMEEGTRGEKLDNFGKFVGEQLDEGLRGRDLAQAIHEEKARRGKGGQGPEGEGPPGQDPAKGGKAGEGPADEPGKAGKGKSGEGAEGSEGKAGKGKGKGGH
jgi:hypothetical protein